MAAKYQLTTLGCKVNQYESQRYRELIESFGLSPVHEGEAPDLAVVNTCAVTSDASRGSRKAIRRFARGGRTAVVVVGCAAGAETQRLRDIEGVIAVLGHQQEIADELRGVLKARYGPSLAKPTYFDDSAGDAGGKPRQSARDDVWMIPIEPASSADAQPSIALDSSAQIIRPSFRIVNRQSLSERIEAFAGHQRAFLKIQDGCDAHCTYCIIPSLRPRLRWKPIDAAVDEARSLVRAGYREIVVTGIFLGAYGRETAIRKRFTPVGSPLAELLAALAGVQGLERVRLSSLEPGDVDDSLLEVLATRTNCVPHLHLPLQSGSGEILRRMNRQYDAEDYLAMIDQVRAALDRPAISTDVIVGFPGETDADFDASVAVARYAKYVKIHAFPFSARPGTAAARWDDRFVPPPVIRDRLRELAVVERECSLDYRRTLIGMVERVIVEGTLRTLPFDQSRDREGAGILDQSRDREGADIVSPSVPTASARAPTLPFDQRRDRKGAGILDQRRDREGAGILDQSRDREGADVFADEALRDNAVIPAGAIAFGRADRYFEVYFEADESIRKGQLISIRLERATPDRTHGTPFRTTDRRIPLRVLPSAG